MLMNNERDDPTFRQNDERLFHARLPHMDTVEDVMRVLKEDDLDTLKTELVNGLLAKKRFWSSMPQLFQPISDRSQLYCCRALL